MDITPLIPGGRQVVESYGEGRFRVSGVLHVGSLLVFPERVLPWAPRSFAEVELSAFSPVLASDGLELLLLGCGPKLLRAPTTLRLALRERGLALETMDTGAACRTYNVLMAEGRRVAAALIAVD